MYVPKLAVSAEISCFKNKCKHFTFVVANGEKILEESLSLNHTLSTAKTQCRCKIALQTSPVIASWLFALPESSLPLQTSSSEHAAVFEGWFAISSSLFCSLFKTFTANPVAWSLLALQLWPSPPEAQPMLRKHPDRALQKQSVVAQPLVPISAMTIKIFIP